MDDALLGMQAAGWTGLTGADADHLKTPEDVDVTAAVGFTFFTIDPSGHVDAHADDYDEPTLRAKFAAVAAEVPWVESYRGRAVKLATGTTVNLDEHACLRAAVKYGRALNNALALADHIARVNKQASRDFEIELSVDETEQPTTLAEHYIIADQCLSRGMKLVSLAPRFIGDFEKGVDYKGDVAALEHSLCDHAAIAALLGPYKLSLHSGSDKLSMYPSLARATKGMFHVKTAGTSYLEALRVVARHDSALFRRIIDFARSRYETDKATYHVSATLASAPTTAATSDPIDLGTRTILRVVERSAARPGLHEAGSPDPPLHVRLDADRRHPRPRGARRFGGSPRHLHRGARRPFRPPPRCAAGRALIAMISLLRKC